MEKENTDRNLPEKYISRESPRRYSYFPPQNITPAFEQGTEEGKHLVDYWAVLVKHRWIVSFCFAIVVIYLIVDLVRSVPVYKATAKIQIEMEKANVLPYKEVIELEPFAVFQDDYLQTQYKILQSRSLARRVIKRLNLEGRPDFNPKFKADLTQINDPPSDSASKLPNDGNQELIDMFLAGLEIMPVKNSRIVEVSFTWPHPWPATEIANTLADEYIQHNFESKIEAVRKATDFLSKQLAEIKTKIEKSEVEMVNYARSHNMLPLDDKQNVTVQSLAELNTALTEAKADRIKKESLYRVTKTGGPNQIPESLKNPQLVQLGEKLNELKRERARLSVNFKSKWPEVAQLEKQIQELEGQLQTEADRILKNIEGDYFAALSREKLLIELVENQKQEAAVQNQNSIRYNILKHEVAVNKQLYDSLLQRLKEATVSAGLKSTNIRIVDKAEIPDAPYKPHRNLKIFLGLLTGLGMGIVSAFFYEYFDKTVKTPEDITRYIALPTLGVIPALTASTSTPPTSNGEDHREGFPVELITHKDGKSLLAERYRSLRTFLLFSEENPPNLILITSAKGKDGKTTTAINTAIVLAQLGRSVVLVDCDLRQPSCHKVMNLKHTKGISEFLSGTDDLRDVIQETGIQNLSIIRCGSPPPNPTELLSSKRMQQALTLLQERFDFVIIDSPPVLPVSDACILATMVDGVLLVVRGQETDKLEVQNAKQNLLNVNARILGIILNAVNIESPEYYYYKRHYYTYDTR